MDKDTFFDNVFIKSPIKYVPVAPLGLWWDTNRGLEDYYNTHGINENNKKNDMRHIVGLARTTQAYGAPLARILGMVKETTDFWSGNQDNVTDFRNNQLGINFIKNNPKATRKEIMDYAYKYSQNKYKQNKSLSDLLGK